MNFTLDMDIKGDISNLLLSSIGDKFPDVKLNVAETNFADYQTSVALSLAKEMKAMGIQKTPREIALEIVENLPENEILSKAETSGPGFINFLVKKEYLVKYFENVRRKRCVPAPIGNGQANVCRAVVDFSSPNIAKEMHVGHLRSTIIGESICRLLEYMQFDVLRLNHVGDWGTQFGMLIAHLMDQTEIKMEIEELQKIYKEAKTKFDNDAEFKKRAYDYVVRLQASDPEVRRTWTNICDVSRKQFAEIYERLNVKLEERGESFYQNLMEELVADLKKRGELVEDEGRWILWNGKDKVPLTIVKSDGGFTYDTSDLAALKHRIEIEKANWIIYVVDMGQGPHFENIFNCAEKLGYSKKETTKLSFVGFGVVLDESKKKFKTRSGDTVKLKDLLDEGLKRAKETLEKKDRHLVLSEDELKAAQEAVAYGCIKYADLCNNRVSEYVFSFDKMLQEKGNTAVYLLYAYTRIKSIIRNSNVNIDELIDSDEPISFEHEKEWKLAKTLAKFNETIKRVQETLCLHHLCDYVYNVATKFTEFYDSCYCIEKDASGTIVNVNKNRILICQITCYFMQQTFDILGLKYVEKM